MSTTEKERTNSISEIRSKLKRHLKKYIGMESAQEKELLIFDKTVSRRAFIGGTLKIGAVATLIGKGMMPSAWASTNPDLALPSTEMPIFTDAEKASYRAVDIDFKSDLVNGVLQQKNIENIPSSALEDTLEAVNVLGCTQVSFNAYQVAKDNANNSRNFGHPEIVRLEGDNIPGHNDQSDAKNHKVTIYEHQASGNAVLTEKTIHLHSFADSVFSVPKEKGFTLHKGDFISNGLFVMELSKDGVFNVYQRDLKKFKGLDSKSMTDELTGYSFLHTETHNKPIDIVCYQTDGNFVGYSEGGKTVEFSKGTQGDFLMDSQSIKVGSSIIYARSSDIESEIPERKWINASTEISAARGQSIIENKLLSLTLDPKYGYLCLKFKESGEWLWSNEDDLKKLYPDNFEDQTKICDHVTFTSDGNLQVRDKSNSAIWSLSLIAASCDEFMYPLSSAILEIEKSGNVSVSIPGGSDTAPRLKYWQTNTHFVEVNAEDTNYNRVVSINGGLHNQVSNGKVRNQKMILVARQPTYHDNDGNPLSQGWDEPNQWVSQSSYITDWTKQMVLLTQNSELDLHVAEHNNQDQLGESFNGGSIADTSGEIWQKWYPLAKLYNEFHKVVFTWKQEIGYGVGIDTDPYKNNQYKVLIEDIGTFKSKDGLFSCIYGTVSANLFCNIGFIITLPDDASGEPIVQFYSLNQDMRRDLISTILERANFGHLFSVNIPSGAPVQGPSDNVAFTTMWSKEYFKQLHRPVAYSNGKLDILYSGIYFDKNGTKPMLSAYQLALPSNNQDANITGYYSDKSGPNDHYWDSNNIVQYSHGEYDCFPKLSDSADKEYKRAYQYLVDAVSSKAHYRFNEHEGAGTVNTTLDSIFWPNEEQDALNFMSLEVEYYGTNPNEPVLYMNYATFKVAYINNKGDNASISSLFNEKLSLADGNYCDNARNCFYYDDIDKYGYPQQALLSFGQDYKFQALIKDHLGNLYSFEQLYSGPLSQWDKTDDGAWVLSPTNAYLINRNDFNQFPALPISGLITRYYQNVERLLKWTAFTKKVEFLVVSNDQYYPDSSIQRLDGTPYANVTTYNNQRVTQHYHYCRQDKVGSTWSDDKINANVAIHETELQQNPVKAQVYDVELSLINADGTLVPDASASIEIRFDDHTYFEFLNAGPKKGMGTYAGPNESIFLKPDNSGRVYFQVKAPDVAQMSGINLSYRIHHPDDYSYSSGEFSRNGSLLTYKENLEETNAFSVFNLAYNVHDRYNQGTQNTAKESYRDASNPDIDVHGKVYQYINNNSSVSGDAKQTALDHLGKTGDALYKSSNSAKKVSMQSPKFMSADRKNEFFTVKLENKQYQLTHLDPAAPYRRYVACIQSGQNNIFTNIWHKLCDAALAVIKRIKQAINAIVNMLNDVLGAIADLGIPGISDLAKIAKGVVSFLGAVINAALDYMAAFINMLKYLFDFKRAQDIGIQVLELLTAVSDATQVKSFSMDKQKLARETLI